MAASDPREHVARHVLFVCNHNAGRSQMAQAFFERDGPDGVRAESAGTEPAAAIWPPVVEVMREIGIDISQRTPKKLTVEMQQHASWAVTMGCGDACPYVPTILQEWNIPDPAGKPLEEVRRIRDQIQEQVSELIAAHIDMGDRS
jgi:arsenate reductase